MHTNTPAKFVATKINSRTIVALVIRTKQTNTHSDRSPKCALFQMAMEKPEKKTMLAKEEKCGKRTGTNLNKQQTAYAQTLVTITIQSNVRPVRLWKSSNGSKQQYTCEVRGSWLKRMGEGGNVLIKIS